MGNEFKEAIEPLVEGLADLRETNQQIVELLSKFDTFDHKLTSSKEFADEARKVIHKRMDKLDQELQKTKDFNMKIIVGVASVALTTLLGVMLDIIHIGGGTW